MSAQATYAPSLQPKQLSPFQKTFETIKELYFKVLLELLIDDKPFSLIGNKQFNNVILINKHFSSQSMQLVMPEEINSRHIFDLSGKKLTSKKFVELFKSGGILAQITKLNLSGAQFDHSLLKELPTTLTYLNLSKTGLNDSAIVHFTHLKKIKNLELNDNQIGVKGTQVIASYFKELKFLHLNGNPMGEEAALEILQALPHFYCFDIAGPAVFAAGDPFMIQKLNGLIWMQIDMHNDIAPLDHEEALQSLEQSPQIFEESGSNES